MGGWSGLELNMDERGVAFRVGIAVTPLSGCACSILLQRIGALE